MQKPPLIYQSRRADRITRNKTKIFLAVQVAFLVVPPWWVIETANDIIGPTLTLVDYAVKTVETVGELWLKPKGGAFSVKTTEKLSLLWPDDNDGDEEIDQ